MQPIDVRRDEWKPLGWAAAWFFSVLASYYAIRPVRDSYGVDAGPNGLRWLFTATFVAMIAVAPLYSLLTAAVSKRRLPAIVYGFFTLNLVGFWLFLRAGAASTVVDAAQAGGDWVRWLFYVWVSVFNLYSVTLFWSVAVDRLSDNQAKRLFGIMAGAGTLGGLAGGTAARWIVREAGVEHVLAVSAGLLVVAIFCARKFWQTTDAAVDKRHYRGADASLEPSGESFGSAMAGLAAVRRSRYLALLAALMILSSVVATSIYMQMSDLVGRQIASASERTDWYAQLNNYQNLLTLVGQFVGASWAIRRWGVGATLAGMALIYAIGFTAIAIHPSLALLGAFDVAQRVASFALGVPAREVLFTTVQPVEKYRAKALIDTVGKRAGDAVAAHAYAAVRAAGTAPSMISTGMLPLTAVIAIVSITLGRRHARRVAETASPNA